MFRNGYGVYVQECCRNQPLNLKDQPLNITDNMKEIAANWKLLSDKEKLVCLSPCLSVCLNALVCLMSGTV